MAIVWLGVVGEEGGVNGGGGNVGSISPLSVAFISLCWIKKNGKILAGEDLLDPLAIAPADNHGNGGGRQWRWQAETMRV
jgi:hypothetical protein